MAADLKEAVENFRNEARRFQAFIELADELDKIGDLRRAANEAQARLDARRRELAALEESGKQEREQAGAVLADARARASALVEQARQEATRLTEEAKRQAEANAARIAGVASTKAEEAEARVAAATAEAEQAEARIGEARKQLGELNRKIGAARAAVAQMLKE